jgi:hypothetical protein
MPRLQLLPYPRPTIDEVHAYWAAELLLLIGNRVPPPVYRAVSDDLYALIRDEFNRPPVMAYDAVREPLRQTMERLLLAKNHLMSAEDEDAVDRFILERMQGNVSLYERDDIEALANEFVAAGIDASMKLRWLATRHGFVASASQEWFDRGRQHFSRRKMARARNRALMLAAGKIPAKYARLEQ